MTSQRFLVLGGGTAGWMTALLFERAFPGCQVMLVESPSVGIIGVGEGSTPALKAFMDAVDVAEHEWMTACKATFKSGITFSGWSDRSGFESYFHPFFTHFDRDHIKALDFNSKLRRAGKAVHAHPNAFAYSHYLAERQRCPVTPWSFPFEVQYGYHFNAGLLGQFLKEKALERGVACREAHISEVGLSANGDVDHLVTEDGEKLEADFFVDCSGFASVITEKTLKTPFISYADALFNDRAVTILTAKEDPVSTQTVSTALNCGWAWRIPLQDRVGNGYVYSSRHCEPKAAEEELRAHLGLPEGEGEARHLSMRVGRVRSSWNRNTLAVGLSQGFLEPLEATALALVQLTIARFVKFYKAGNNTNQYAGPFNDMVGEAFDGVKDYIHTHFLTSNRSDTNYWRDCRQNEAAISDRLKRVFEAWNSNGDLAEVLQSTGLNRHYKINSWIYILGGMGLYPPEERLQPPEARELELVPMASITDFFERLTLNHMSQQEALEMQSDGRSPFDSEGQAQTSADEVLAKLLGLGFAVSS